MTTLREIPNLTLVKLSKKNPLQGSDGGDMFFDCQVMTMTSCPGKGTLTAPPTFAIPSDLLKIMKSNPKKDPVMIVQEEINKLEKRRDMSES